MKKRLAIIVFIVLVLMNDEIFVVKVNAKEDKKIIIFSAMGLYEPVNEICKEFEKKNEIKILCNFGSSKALSTQAIKGYHFDIVMFANYEDMEELKKKKLINNYEKFVKSHLVIVKNKKCEVSIRGLKDLANESIKIAVGEKSIPCGQYWNKALDKSLKEKVINNKQKENIEKNIKTRELTVKDVLTKVLIGYVDVGIIYETVDLKEKYKDKIEVISIPELKNVEAIFTIAISNKSGSIKEIKDLYAFITNKKLDVFKKYGFDIYSKK